MVLVVLQLVKRFHLDPRTCKACNGAPKHRLLYRPSPKSHLNMVLPMCYATWMITWQKFPFVPFFLAFFFLLPPPLDVPTAAAGNGSIGGRPEESLMKQAIQREGGSESDGADHQRQRRLWSGGGG